jgi:hypothetical protein
MNKRHSLAVGLVVLLALTAGWAQDSSTQESSGLNPQQTTPPSGETNTVPPISENPPISGIDMPNLEPHAAPLSYLQLGAHVSESEDSNIENSLGGSSTQSISRADGSLELRRLWSHYDLALDYLGGVGYYNVRGVGLRQIEELGLAQKIMWKRGQFGIRDAFSYQPEGSFGTAYGAIGATGAGLTGLGAFFGGIGLGELGQVPRIMNLTLADATEMLTPKSFLTAIAGYGFVHFLQNDPETGTSFIGNSEVTAEVGYDRMLGPHDQVALVYGYQGFHFSTGVTFHNNLIQLMWGHRISGRMDFLLGVGPQFTEIDNLLAPVNNPTPADTIPPCVVGISQGNFVLECPTNDLRISAAGRATLRYQFPKVSLTASYEHFLTSGSGFFAGAESDIVRASATRPLGRVWSVFTDIGYSRNSSVLPITCTAALNCPGVTAEVYQYGFAGVGAHRMFGRNFHGYFSYQYNGLAFDSSYCATTSPCNRTSQRQVGTIGLDWIPRPIRLD